MALTYISPIEGLLSSLTSVEQSQIASTAVTKYKNYEADNFDLFNYNLSPKAKEKLYESGIYLSPFSAMAHSHPVCKTLENYFLYRVLPSYLDNSFYLVGIKKHKVEFLKRRDPSLKMLEVVNRYVSSLDKLRYGPDFCIQRLESKDIGGRKLGGFDSPTLRNLIPKVIANKGRSLFLHDEIHYWNKADLYNFLDLLRPGCLLATMVFPPEILAGSKVSLNRWCYEYEIHKDRLFFYPDRVRAEGYVQPVAAGFLLKTKRIILEDGTVYCVDLVHSKFAHHLISITLGDALPQETRSFGGFEAVSSRHLSKLCKNVTGSLPISHIVVSKIYRYMRTLKKPDVESAMAKLGQLVPEPTGFEIKFIQEFAEFIIETHNENKFLCPKFFKGLIAKGLGMLPNVFARWFSGVKSMSLDNFISNLGEFSFIVDLQDMDRRSDFKTFWFEFAHEIRSCIDFDELSDNIQLVWDSLFEKTAPYSLDGIEATALNGKYVLEVNENAFYNMIIAYLHTSYVQNNCFMPWYREMREVVDELLSRHPFSYAFQHLVNGSRLREIYVKLGKRWLRERLELFDPEEPTLWFISKVARRYHMHYLECPVTVNTRLNYRVVIDLVKQGQVPELKRNLDVQYDKGYMGYVSPFFCTKPKLNHDDGKTAPLEHKESLTTKGVEKNEKAGLKENVSEDECTDGVEKKGTPPVLGNTTITLDDVVKAVGKPNESDATRCITLDDLNGVSDSESATAEAEFLCCDCGIALEITSTEVPFQKLLSFPDSLKGRRAAWYARSGQGYKYNGGQHKSLEWLECFDSFLQKNGHAGKGYNSVLAQVYNEGACIPFHSDDEEIFQKNSPILTVQVCGSAIFSVRGKNCCGAAMTEGTVMFEMPPGFQETHKHSVSNCAKGRISLTFRVIKCTSGMEKMLNVEPSLACSDPIGYDEEIYAGHDNYTVVQVPGDGDCFWHSVGYFMGLNGRELKNIMKKRFVNELDACIELDRQMEDGIFAERESIIAFLRLNEYNIRVHCPSMRKCILFTTRRDAAWLNLLLEQNHYSPLSPKNDCVVVAIAKSLNRKIGDIYKVIQRPENAHLHGDLEASQGISSLFLGEIFTLFDIRAKVCWDGDVLCFNDSGRLYREFTLCEGHLELAAKESTSDLKLLRRSDVTDFSTGALAVLKKAGTELWYSVSSERAEIIAKSLLDGDTGAISSRNIDGSKDYLDGVECKSKLRLVTAIIGTFGAGKSTLFKRFFKQSEGKHVTFVSPRAGLAQEVRSQIFERNGPSGNPTKRDGGSRHWSVLTFEVFLKKMNMLKEKQVLIFDEAQLYPPCYMDLVLMCIPESIRVYMVGDPCQSDYDSERDRNILSGLEGDLCKLLNGKEYRYNLRSRRFTNSMFVGRLPCKFDESKMYLNEPYHILESFEELDTFPQRLRKIFLVSSFDEKKIVSAHYGKAAECYTFGESTGRNFDFGVILVTSVSRMVSERRWVTALSRFSVNVIFVNLLGVPSEQMHYLFDGRVLTKFLCGTAKECDLYEMLPGTPKFITDFAEHIGKDEGKREEKLAGDPWLKTMIDLNQKEDMEIADLQEFEEQENWFKTHLPRCELESIRAGWLHKICAKEHREIWIKQLRTEQFNDEHSKNKGAILTNAAERFETIYPRHRNGDTATFLMAVKKRMRFSRPSVENAKLRDAEVYGEFLLKKFLEKVPLKPRHNKEFMASALEDFYDKKTSKSAATIENHSGRSCRDWLADVAFIFMKNQLCTKYEKRFVNAKAAQSIVCFQHSVLCRFAPYMRYIEKKLNEVLPKNFYIHSGKGLEELNAWVIANKFDGVCTESDYEAFDASQDQYIMAFELAVMKHLALPRDLIEDYRYIKTHLGSKLGNFAIMRFSGEASTFLFNTMANMLFTFLRYDINGSESICFAGDDMCASKRLRSTDEHEGFLGKLRLKAKVDFTRTPTFCGWNLTPVGIFKKPQLVFERMCIAKELNNLKNCIDNYALEVAFAYKLGEEATCRMSEEEVANHYQCVRTIIQNKHHIKSDVMKVFESSRL